MSKHRVLALVLAGGQGGRMGVLTEGRAKPVLPFAGTHRLIDFPLNNCVNSGITDVWVVQQYEPHALNDHLANGRPWDLDRSSGGLLVLPPFEGDDDGGGGWSEGNADALWRQRELLVEWGADVILVLSADAVHTMDYAEVVDAHVAHDADVTMAVTAVKDENPSRFGVVQVGEGDRVTRFDYKPDEPDGDLVTMEIFAYRPTALLETMEALASEAEGKDDGNLKDFGDGLLPRLVEAGRAYAYRFDGYWRDVGMPASYWAAHQDLFDGLLARLDDPAWPVRTAGGSRPPAMLSASAEVATSLISPGCRIDGRVVRSVLGPGVTVAEGAEVVDSVVMHDTTVAEGAAVAYAIVDGDVTIGRDATVGRPRGEGIELTLVGAGVAIPPGADQPAGDEISASGSRTGAAHG